MHNAQPWLWKGLLPLAGVLLLLALAWSRGTAPSTAADVPRAKSPAAAPGLPVAGTASCSARGCHGGIEAPQNEFTLWLRDPHAEAYQVLLGVRARQMAERLGGGKPAQDDPRCLACHVNPRLTQATLAQEWHFGVGCEACHGDARAWLAPHTSKNWRSKTHAEKADLGMAQVADLSRRAEICAGCHVGAPAGQGMPLRDVNHDLIAAGHPRLQFELSSYQANMPAHWRPGKDSPAALWQAGQLASAQAALDLLAARSETGPWPEFAEYDCFACHHALNDKRDRSRGTLPWGSWYFTLPRALADDLPALTALTEQMQKPYPDRNKIAGMVAHARAELAKRRGDITSPRLLDRFKNDTLRIEPRWDAAEQLYLALYAPRPSQRLQTLAKERAFPPGYDSPLSWPDGNARPIVARSFLEKLRSVASDAMK